MRADIVAEKPKPWDPYANKHMGRPMLPVFGITNGGNSLIMSFVFCINKKNIPTTKNKAIATR